MAPLPPVPRQAIADAPGTFGWVKSAESPAVVAGWVDKRFRNIADVSGNCEAYVDSQPGQGDVVLTISIKSPTVFRYDYPIFGKTERHGLEQGTNVADGHRFVEYLPEAHQKPVALGARPALDTKGLADRWFWTFARDMFAGVGNQQSPFSAFVRAAQSRGFSVVAEKRTLSARGRQVSQHRIIVTDPALAKRHGRLLMEMIVDDYYHLPVTIRMRREVKGVHPDTVAWRADWSLGKHHRFDPKLFDIR